MYSLPYVLAVMSCCGRMSHFSQYGAVGFSPLLFPFCIRIRPARRLTLGRLAEPEAGESNLRCWPELVLLVMDLGQATACRLTLSLAFFSMQTKMVRDLPNLKVHAY